MIFIVIIADLPLPLADSCTFIARFCGIGLLGQLYLNIDLVLGLSHTQTHGEMSMPHFHASSLRPFSHDTLTVINYTHTKTKTLGKISDNSVSGPRIHPASVPPSTQISQCMTVVIEHLAGTH